MLNASVGMQRVLGRLRTDQRTRSPLAIRLHRRTVNAAQAVHEAAVARIAGARTGTSVDEVAEPQAAESAPTRSVRDSAAVRLRLAVRRRVGREAALPVAVASIVLASSLLSVLPDAIPAGPVGGPVGEGVGPRIAVGGQGTVLGAFDQAGEPISSSVNGPRFRAIDPEALAIREEPSPSSEPIGGAFLDDGTLVKPVAVDTSIADGSDLLRTYTVKKGDTLVAIADAHGVSMMTVWWANSAKIGTKEGLPAGTVLTIPPVTGLIHQVKEGDSLDSLATKYKIEADAIYDVNGLEDRALVIGQTLVLPGAAGDPIPTPKPTARSRSGGTTTRPVAGPATYAGGSFGWPVAGGGNYISQYFRSGHYGLDIAADYGSSVMSGGAGTVIFAGWKNNGGGYQVWIAHGSGLYTTYNHMSAVTVGAGQSVGRGQQVGRIGQSGWATGPHLHFEVWRGEIWNGGRRVNPLLYL